MLSKIQPSYVGYETFFRGHKADKGSARLNNLTKKVFFPNKYKILKQFHGDWYKNLERIKTLSCEILSISPRVIGDYY